MASTASSIRASAMADVSSAIDTMPPAAEATPWREFWSSYGQSRGAVLGLGIVVGLIVLAALAGVVSPHPPNEQFRDYVLIPPAWQEGGVASFPLGTDPVGRDMLSRLIHGTRLSL